MWWDLPFIILYSICARYFLHGRNFVLTSSMWTVWRRMLASDWAMAQTDWERNMLWIEERKNTLNKAFFYFQHKETDFEFHRDKSILWGQLHGTFVWQESLQCNKHTHNLAWMDFKLIYNIGPVNWDLWF